MPDYFARAAMLRDRSMRASLERQRREREQREAQSLPQRKKDGAKRTTPFERNVSASSKLNAKKNS